MNINEIAIKQVMNLIRHVEPITLEVIKNSVTPVVQMLENFYPGQKIDQEKLYRDILNITNVYVASETELRDDSDHVEWLHDRKSEIKWKFWNRYKHYLEDVKSFSPLVVTRLNALTDNILGKLEDPERQGKWDRRGMVVGYVQSGKTLNYTGLICKAADAGYKLIVVLAGMHNDLRSQTQVRLDQDFLGYDTRLNREYNNTNRKIGVGNLIEHGELVVHSLTSSADNGDYRTQVARNVGFMLGGDPVILVVKKNASVLKNLLRWIQSDGRVDPETGEVTRENIPLLLIDDEADNASVDGKQGKRDEYGNLVDEESDPTTINRLIRQLLKTFQKSSYVGYTATPFANIFIYPPDESENIKKFGEDLFPRSFIINLPPPSNYVGPVQVFGLEEDDDLGLDEQKSLPIVKVVDDYDHFIPDKHKKDVIIPDLPPSLKKAIKVFILSCAARMARGQINDHKSMLIHVTRFTAVQNQIKDLVLQEHTRILNLIEFEGENKESPAVKELRNLWDSEFKETTRKVKELWDDASITNIEWEEVKSYLFEAAMKIQIKEINGSAKDVLDYRDHPKGMSVIAIGGDKLSRGITLEGLSVSYYLRASKMYDTLMQMGRWFGYRPGYLDLCRLYTSEELVGWYKHIAMANEELRKEFDFMAATGGTPLDYGLRVRTHPDGLQITASNKLNNGTKMAVSFSGGLSETVVFHKSKEKIEKNFKVLEKMIHDLGAESKYEGSYVWEHVSTDKVVEFLEGYTTHPFSRKAETSTLIKYINNLVNEGELQNWTIVLLSSKTPRNKFKIGGKEIGLIQRQDDSEHDTNKWMLAKGRLLSPKDEYRYDLNDDQIKEALVRTVQSWQNNPKKRSKEAPKVPSGPYIRSVRPVQNGLLLIYPLDNKELLHVTDKPIVGFSISFPKSNRAKEVEYIVDTRYWRNIYGED
ncbi:endonuclease [Mesobacillus boroniphilus]|uniref:Endonuclease n=1 Tax=Mesobacillus boroniphilus TaxID=308892 RepID=A0A944CIP4_9BACI|nr:Z1 domain-containing protein [Mesobacillus boroniphilus]MBS8263849.1 endonuclease [Mesobacillus boroniphilus]